MVNWKAQNEVTVDYLKVICWRKWWKLLEIAVTHALISSALADIMVKNNLIYSR
jgi:hypothetical protein